MSNLKVLVIVALFLLISALADCGTNPTLCSQEDQEEVSLVQISRTVNLGSKRSEKAEKETVPAEKQSGKETVPSEKQSYQELHSSSDEALQRAVDVAVQRALAAQRAAGREGKKGKGSSVGKPLTLAARKKAFDASLKAQKAAWKSEEKARKKYSTNLKKAVKKFHSLKAKDKEEAALVKGRGAWATEFIREHGQEAAAQWEKPIPSHR